MMNFHEIRLEGKKLCISEDRIILVTCLLEDLKILALSEIMVAGSPLRPANRRRASKNVSTPMFLVNSKWTARVAVHVNKQTYTDVSGQLQMDCSGSSACE